MATNYANAKLAAAIRDHLLNVDAVPPNAEASRLAGELAQICLQELNSVGLGSETVENLFAPSAPGEQARGAHKTNKGNRPQRAPSGNAAFLSRPD